MGPVFTAGALLGFFHIGHITYRQRGGSTDAVIALSSAWTVCIVGVCGAFVVGLVRRRMLLAGALARLGAALRADTSQQQMRSALATALSDSSIEPLFREAHGGGWRDASGRPVAWPRPPEPGRAVTTIGADDRSPEVVLIHDVALCDDQELLHGVSGIVLAAWRHEQMMAGLAQAMSDLEQSRRRIAEAADLETVRIERDLHDGAQQRLVALRIRLGLAQEQLRTDPSAGIRAVEELGFEAERALEELRSIAHGVYPSLLADRGLVDALVSLARQAPIPIYVSGAGISRQPIEIESAVYFTCAEAVQNAVKHARGATGVWITISETPGTLRFKVCDDGAGFIPSELSGHGLRNMRDRIDAIGGHLEIQAESGHGTQVRGSVELP